MTVTVIRGRVLDGKQRPVTGARIFIVSAPVSMPDIAQVSDARGGFSLSLPRPGTYRIGVMAEGFVRQERDLIASDAVQDELDIRLEANRRP